MSIFSCRPSMFLGAVLAIGSLSAIAEPTNEFKSNVTSKAAFSDKGVIVVITERGDAAVQAAYLLSAQLQQNVGYAPLLMAAEQYELAAYMHDLDLSKGALRAVIFYDKTGKELNRVVSIKPAVNVKLGEVDKSIVAVKSSATSRTI